MIGKKRNGQVARTRAVVARLRRRAGGRIGLVLLTLFVAGSIVGPWVAPDDPLAQDLARRLESPSASHLLGTDEFGTSSRACCTERGSR
jgi:peptide/nickel transport system permease protein